MTKNKTVTHYAKITHGQPNMNQSDAKSRRDWGNVQLSCSTDGITKPKGDSDSFYEYSKIGKSVVEGKPWTFTGHDFNFDIPSCAYIKRIVFKVRMMIDGKIIVKVPRARFNFYHGTKNVSNNIKENTGWKDNVYFSMPNQNIPHTFQDIEYVMSGEDFRKRGYPISELNEERMGIDLNWWNPVKNPSYNSVRIQYVSCTVEYEMPDESIVFDEVSSEDTPLMRKAGEEFGIVVKYRNNSNAGCCGNTSKKIKVDLPPNVDVRALNGNYNPSTSEWTVNCTPNAYYFLLLGITDYGIGEKPITVSGTNIKPNTLWYYSSPQTNDIGTVTPFPDTYMQKGLNSCITFKSKVNASDGEAIFWIDMDTAHPSYSGVKWSIVENETDTGVTLGNHTDDMVIFNVPSNKVVNITFKGCFVPKQAGNTSVEVAVDDGDPTIVPYVIKNAPHFILRNESKTDEKDRETAEIVLNPCIINFVTHRIASTTELGAYVIDCGIAPFDNSMVEKECTLTADAWEPVDYIGPVPLEYHHYDPDSTYSNKAVSDAYKNKTYKGKEGIIDEKISLKWKCRPWEAPTFQGLTKLDKPTPINANHKCFEGDPLNHRGWVVLSEVKINRTNPLWYDMEGDVDYITHDIYTKFQIFKGLTVNSTAMPDLTAEVFSQGENLAEGLDIFNVDTDGGFIYDEDGDETAKNIFSLDEGQHLNIKTIKELADVSVLDFEWYSTCINEKRENNIERVFRLVNDNGESVLEYEYTNFQFNEDYVTCDVVVRVKTDDGWKEPIYFYDVDLRTELEAELIEEDEDEEVIVEDEWIEGDEPEGEDYDTDVIDTDDETAYEEGYIAPTIDVNQYNITEIYGSTLQFVLNGNKLKIFDAGYNGSEITSEDIELVAGKYYFECVWKNNNRDGTTEDIISYIDIGLSETILNTDYSEQYSNLRVSPFPIPYKKVVFTRDSEEGTIYYLAGEEPFKYLLEPYYQYHCGCDLLGDKTSIFDLNNSYTHYYIENGLVRLGFNKYNARLYLAKYDPTTKQWITTHYFHMTNEPKFSVESYSDDKIVIKAGTDTFFTIWRGRPYIGIKNPTDVIYIDSNFNYCLSDMVEDDKYDYPIIHSFMNTWNLLPNGIGGKRLDGDDIVIDDDMEIITTPHTVTIPTSQLEDIVAKEDITLTPTITPSVTTGKAHLIVDGVDVAESETPFTLSYNFPNAGNYKVYIVYVGATDEDDIAISPVYDVSVATPTPTNPDQDEHKEIPGNYNLAIVSAPSKMTYRDGSKVIVELKKGTTPVKDVIEIPLPDGRTITKYTRASDGRYEIINDSIEYSDTHTLFVPGKYQWGARFYDPTASDVNAKMICEALRYITIEKATPTFTHNDADGKVSKGKNLTVKLNGVDSKANPNKAGLAGKKVTYSIEGGKKISAKTDENGKFKVKFNNKGTKKLKVMFAGSVRYKAVSKTFTIKVV